MDFDFETSVLLIKILFLSISFHYDPMKVRMQPSHFKCFQLLSHGWGGIKQANTVGNFDYLTKEKVSLFLFFGKQKIIYKVTWP